MIVKERKFKIIQIEEGKTYKTSFQTGELFLVTKLVTRKNTEIVIEYEGIYLNHRHLGVCPLAVGRLVYEKVEDGFKYVCNCCGEEVNLKQFDKLIKEHNETT